MRAVVADTGPLNYLVLIEQVSILPRLFQTVFVPRSVQAELGRPRAPQVVRDWIAMRPRWLVVREDETGRDTEFEALDNGEREAIKLAERLNAGLILMDDRAAVAVARSLGLKVTGTLGVLDLAARRGLVDLAVAFERLRKTSFRCRPDLLEAILAAHAVGP